MPHHPFVIGYIKKELFESKMIAIVQIKYRDVGRNI